MTSTPGTRRVAALDITVTGVSAALYDEAAGQPFVRYISAPGDAGAVHNVATTLHRHRTVVKAVVETLCGTKDAPKPHPELVALVKLSWGLMHTDPSGARRIGLWFAVAEALTAKKIPVAEVPLLTVQAWAGCGAKFGAKGFAALTADVTAQYPVLEAAQLPDRCRMTTAAVAAAAAMAAGISTKYEVTQARLDALSGFAGPPTGGRESRVNKGIQWPAACRPPRTVAEWNRLHETGSRAEADEDEDAEEVSA